MSISLNDHENRIMALEQASNQMKSEFIFNGNSNAKTISLTKSVTNFDGVVIHYYTTNANPQGMVGYTTFIPRVLYNTNLGCPFSSDRTQAMIKVYDNIFQFVEEYNRSEHLKYVVGIKWGGGYKLRNFAEKITSLYQNILKTISLTILGGEVI